MRCRDARIIGIRLALNELPWQPGRPTGAAAANVTDDEAARLSSRADRYLRKVQGLGYAPVTGEGGLFSALDRRARRRRRAKQTHPGKRGRR